jgi:hypothetical protein
MLFSSLWRSWSYLLNKPTELIRVIAIAVSASVARCERARKGCAPESVPPSLQWAAGDIWEGGCPSGHAPRGPLTPGADKAAAFSAAAQPKPGVAPARLGRLACSVAAPNTKRCLRAEASPLNQTHQRGESARDVSSRWLTQAGKGDSRRLLRAAFMSLFSLSPLVVNY